MPDGLRGLCCRLQLDAADHAALLASAAAARLKGGKSLLHHAARAGQLALLRQVITAAPEAVRVADDAGHLPLHDGSDEAMVLLHEAAPDTAMAAGCHGKLMLHEAVARVVNRTVRAIPPLVRLLGNGSESVQEGAARALLSLVVNNAANQAAIGAAGAILPRVRLLGSAMEGVQEEAARVAIRDLASAAVGTGDVGMVGELLASGQLQELIDDPTGALLLAAVERSVVDAPSSGGAVVAPWHASHAARRQQRHAAAECRGAESAAGSWPAASAAGQRGEA